MRNLLSILLALMAPIAGVILTEAPAIWPISTLLYTLGLLYSFSMIPKNKVRGIAFIVVAASFFIVEVSYFLSYYIQNFGFNKAFFYHVRPDILNAGVNEFAPFLLLSVACMISFLVVSLRSLDQKRPLQAWRAFVAMSFIALGLFISPPVRDSALYLSNLSQESMEGSLFEDFPELSNPNITVKFTKSKQPNIILIYAESLEQRYFDENVFPELLPKLRKLREQSIDYSNVSQGIGAEWTIGGIVASQCGYPLTISHDIDGNDFSLFEAFLPRATCLGDLLQKDGYNLSYIGGANAIFAGKDKFLRSHGYTEVIDQGVLQKELGNKAYVHGWGVYDDLIFDYAANKYELLSKEKSPFLLTVLTLDSHGYKGSPSRSCIPYGSGESSILNSLHCSDQLISKFIEKVRASAYSENTIIVVLSDHLAMRNQSTSLLGSSHMPKRLTFFVNTPNFESRTIANPGLHYDVAPTILDVLGYHLTGQMGFGASLDQGPGYLISKFGENRWEEHSTKLESIGSTLWDSEVALNDDGIRFILSNMSLRIGGREFNLRSWGASNVPASTLFIFNNNSLQIEKIKAYAFDKGISAGALSKELTKVKDKLVFVIGRAKNLPGFSAPGINPMKWVYFCEKPGGNLFLQGVISGDLQIPFDLIKEFNNSELDNNIIQQRQSFFEAVLDN